MSSTCVQRSTRRRYARVCLAAALVVVAGCSSSTSEPTSTSTPTNWVPSKPLTAPSLSTAEMMQARAANLKQSAEDRGLGSPAIPDLVRWTTPEEQIPVLKECLGEQGYNVRISGGGSGIESSVGPAQASAFEFAFWQCEAMYSIDARLYNFPSAAQEMDYLWDYWNEFVIGCLAANGHPARRELPSRQVFAGDDSWFIQQAYPDITDDAESTRLQRACPPTPPSSLLLGQGWKPTGS